MARKALCPLLSKITVALTMAQIRALKEIIEAHTAMGDCELATAVFRRSAWAAHGPRPFSPTAAHLQALRGGARVALRSAGWGFPIVTTQGIIREPRGGTCRCGHKKELNQSFCRRCYYRLPGDLRIGLYNRIPKGYERVHRAACEYLDANGRAAGSDRGTDGV